MSKSKSNIAYDIIAAGGDTSRPVINKKFEEICHVPIDPYIYPLVKRGCLKREMVKGVNMYRATDKLPTFEPAREMGIKKKRKYKRQVAMGPAPAEFTQISAVMNNGSVMGSGSPQVAEPSTEDQNAIALEQMANSHSAIAAIRSASALIRFAQLTELHGPDKAEQVLLGFARFMA